MILSLRRRPRAARELFRTSIASALGLLFFVTGARAHPEPHPLDISSEVLGWVQPDGALDWDLSVIPFDGSGYVRPARPEPMPICWQEDLYDDLDALPGKAAIVWLRSRANIGASRWVGPRLVSVPEPSVSIGVLMGAFALSWARRMRWLEILRCGLERRRVADFKANPRPDIELGATIESG